MLPASGLQPCTCVECVMRLGMKGLAKVKKTLASGQTIYYCYPWRGGPLLKGPDGRPIQPDDPALPAVYIAARERRDDPQTNDMAMLIRRYLKSTDFSRTASDTRREYRRYLDQIRDEFGEFSIAELERPATRGKFKEWRDTMADRPRTADYAWMILARVLSFAKDRGLLAINICQRGGRLSHGSRVDAVWSDADIARFAADAPSYMRLALQMGLWTGQRQGDLLRLTWGQYDGSAFRLEQRKTKSRVVVPVAAPLRAEIERTALRGPMVLVNSRGKPWTQAGFQTSWRKACEKAGVSGLTFHDLRGTAVTRMAVAGCTVPEIAALTGHSMRDVHRILDAHYLAGKDELARNAVAKMEMAVLKRERECDDEHRRDGR